MHCNHDFSIKTSFGRGGTPPATSKISRRIYEVNLVVAGAVWTPRTSLANCAPACTHTHTHTNTGTTALLGPLLVKWSLKFGEFNAPYYSPASPVTRVGPTGAWPQQISSGPRQNIWTDHVPSGLPDKNFGICLAFLVLKIEKDQMATLYSMEAVMRLKCTV